jgi:hypothetical protein
MTPDYFPLSSPQFFVMFWFWEFYPDGFIGLRQAWAKFDALPIANDAPFLARSFEH